MADVWSMIAAERTALADDLDRLTEAQWQSPSAIIGWQVRHVVSHLVWPLETPLSRLIVEFAKHRFHGIRAADTAAASERRSGPELARALRAHAFDKRFRFPGFPVSVPLTEIVVHALDVRAPLRIAHAIPREPARIVLDLLLSPLAARGFAPPRLCDGLRFEATDLEWFHGAGPCVAGTSQALLLSLVARKLALEELQGEGAAILRDRVLRLRRYSRATAPGGAG